MTNLSSETHRLQQKSAQSEKISLSEQRREEVLADPILSFNDCWENSGVSRSTFYRSVLPQLEVVHLSKRRRGVRSSVFAALMASRSKPAGA